MTNRIVNLVDLELRPFGHGVSMPGAGDAPAPYSARIAWIGPRVGAQKLGYNLTVLPPGKRAFPCHAHSVNEEMFFVLEGTGEIVLGDEHHPLRAGDVVACPPGGPATAHQIVNTSDRELRYLAVSTKLSPDVVVYPQTSRFGLLAELPTDDGQPRVLRFVGREDDSRPYWEGE